MNTTLDRIPPHDVDAERCVLGAMLISDVAARLTLESVTVEDFYAPANKIIFHVLADLHRDYGHADEELLTSELNFRKKLDQVGGREAIGRLIINTPSAAGIEGYLDIVQRNRILRDAEQQALGILRDVENGNVERIRESFPASAIPVASCGLESFETAFDCDILTPPRTISTGLLGLDDALDGGFVEGSLVLLCGCSGDFKSTILRGLFDLAGRAGRRAGLITLEDSVRMAKQKLIALNAGVPFSTLRWIDEHVDRGGPTEEERERIAGARTLLKSRPLFIGELKQVSDIDRAAALLATHQGLEILFIDQSSWILPGEYDHEYDRASKVSRAMKEMAKRLGIVVVMAVQANRDGQKARRKAETAEVSEADELQLWHLRQCGEEDADTVILIKSVDRYAAPYKATLGIDKNRWGERYRRTVLEIDPHTGAIADYAGGAT